MDVLLLVPNSKYKVCRIPLEFGYVAASLKRYKFSVSIINGAVDNMSERELERRITVLNPKVVLIQVDIINISSVKDYISKIKQIDPRIHVILTGDYIAGIGHHVYNQFPKISYAFYGELERSLIFLMRRILRGERIRYEDIFGLIWKKSREIILNKRDFNNNLDSLGFADWDLIEPEKYKKMGNNFLDFDLSYFPILFSRGCTCSARSCELNLRSGKKIRKRSIQKIVGEIEFLNRKYGITKFHIKDDNLIFDRKRLFDFCDLIKHKKIKINLAVTVMLCVSYITEQMLDKMKQAGLSILVFEVPSASKQVLNNLRVNINLHDVLSKIKLANKLGIKTCGSFSLGSSIESKKQIKETIKFSRKSGVKFAIFKKFLVKPGTDISSEYNKKGMLRMKWEDIFKTKKGAFPNKISFRQLEKIQKIAYNSFYFGPLNTIKLLFSGKLKNILSVMRNSF